MAQCASVQYTVPTAQFTLHTETCIAPLPYRQVEVLAAEVTVLTPDGQQVTANFDLGTLL